MQYTENVKHWGKIKMPDNFERYNRNILVPEVGIKGQKKLSDAKVLVCGAGGLGSTVIVNLASLGVGHIGIIDNDTVELSNLNRQYIHNLSSLKHPKTDSAKAWVQNYNRDIQTETFKIRLDKKNYIEIVAKYDILADCFDSFESKFLLNDIAIQTGKPLVHAGVSEFKGQVMTILPKKSACLRCLMPDASYTENYVAKGVVSPAVSAIASIESMEILKLILGKGSLLTDKILIFDGLNTRFRTLDVQKNSKCICNR